MPATDTPAFSLPTPASAGGAAQTPAAFELERIRHTPRLRPLTVRHVESLSPSMRRITLEGESLGDFRSDGFDDHVKLMWPASGTDALPALAPGPEGLRLAPDAPRPIMRDYTPSRFDPATRTLDIDFVLHGDGVASEWAARARPGDALLVAGPRGSMKPPDRLDWHLLIGDEAALPAIRRRLAELAADQQALVFVEVDDAASRLPLESAARVDARWRHRRDDASPTLVDLLRAVAPPPGLGFAWAAAESSVAREIRKVLVDEWGLDRRRVRVASYWRDGETGVHETIDD